MSNTNGTLDHLYALVGAHAVLLPLPFGQKKPQKNWLEWQRTDYERTQEPDYQKELNDAIERKGNIGVLLVDGLATIDIDADQLVEEFLPLNPKLAETLRSRGARGCNFWIKPLGDYPARIHFLRKTDGTKWGEWRGNGQTVIGGQHPDGFRYQRLVDKPAVEIAFDSINWPADVVLPWKKAPSAADPKPAPELDKRVSAYIAAIPGAVSGEGGHSRTFKVACVLVNGWALSAAEAMPYLQNYNQRCEPPWTDKELVHKLADAEKSLHEKPSGHLRDDPQPSAEMAEPTINWAENPANTDGGQYDKHKAVYPPDSILEDYMQFVRAECEAADPFILGSILPICAAQLARRVRFPWGSSVKFPNIFSMLAGPPGDRKSSAIEVAHKIAKESLTASAFLPENFSPESLFDEYDTRKNGRPDKLWVCDDANIILTDWRKTSNGERVAGRFLRLYDCGDLTESFRRNKEKEKPVTKRTIQQTSTSIIFGATFNVACFQGQAIRAGLARRFIYYVAEGHGRLIEIPKDSEITELAELFSRLNGLSGNLDFTPDARKLWVDYQQDNRIRHAEVDVRNEAEAARLSSEPMQALKIAMIFQACVCAKQRSALSLISKNVLHYAIEHMTENLESACFLDSIADRESARDNAEILYAKIRKDFHALSRNGTIRLRRTDITCTYAPHSSRPGAWSPNDIFLKFLPVLIRQGDARLLEKKGKTEVYAIRDQD